MTERLIHPDEAIRTVASFLREPELETVSLAQALGRALARPVVGGLDHPPFDKAAMDGWAWKPALEGEIGRASCRERV